MEEQKTKNQKLPWMIATGALLVLMMGVIALNVIMLLNNQKISKYIDDERARQAAELNNGEYVEDGYSVGGTYEIRSTKNISDAYISKDTSKLTDDENKTLELAKAVLDEVIQDGMSAYEQEIAIIDWMCANLETGESTTIVTPGTTAAEMVSTPAGVLSGKHAVCVGYATTFRLLVNMLGMDCHIVHNDYHSWDLVQLDDGNWYHVDIYSEKDQHLYQQVNMTDAECLVSHTWDGTNYLPSATSSKYSYANVNAQTINDVMDIPGLVYEKTSTMEQSVNLFYRMTNGFSDLDQAAADTIVTYLEIAFQNSPEESMQSKSVQSSWSGNIEEGLILSIYVVDSNYKPTPSDSDLDEEKIQEIIQAIDDAFGTNLGEANLPTDYDQRYGYFIGTLEGYTYYVNSDGVMFGVPVWGDGDVLQIDDENQQEQIIKRISKLTEDNLTPVKQIENTTTRG